MQDNISVIIATILAVIIIVIFPIYNIATRQDSATNNTVVEITTNFVDEIRTKGYITEQRYQQYVDDLTSTGNMYQIEMEVHSPILLRTDGKSEDGESYEEDYEVNYTSNILEKLNEVNEFSADSIIKTGVYKLNEGDKFYVRVKNTNMTQAQVLLGKIFGGSTDSRIVVNYGGVIYSSEWAVSEYRNSTAYNVAISRPRDLSGTFGKEYKYETIFSGVDEITGEQKEVNGIAVRLEDDSVSDKRGIRFELKYTNAVFLDDSGNKIENNINITKKVKEKISLSGFNANTINVKLISKVNDTYIFTIDLTDIELYYNQTIAIDSYIQIAAGSASAIIGKNNDGSNKLAEIGTIKSREFIVFYEVKELTIDYLAKYYNGNTLITGVGEVDKAKIEVELNKSNENIETVRYSAGQQDITYFNSGNGIEIKNTYGEVENKYSFTVDENGTYTIYARDKYGKEAISVIVDITGIGSDRLRFVLYWNGGEVKDVDSYMQILDSEDNSLGIVCYSKKTFEYGKTYVYLNQDVTSGSSITQTEMLTLERANGEIFRYWIQDYTHRSSNTSPNLANSQPVLVIYRGKEGSEKKIYDSSQAGQGLIPGSIGTRWNVLEYNSTTRTIRWVNTLALISEGFVEKGEAGR